VLDGNAAFGNITKESNIASKPDILSQSMTQDKN